MPLPLSFLCLFIAIPVCTTRPGFQDQCPDLLTAHCLEYSGRPDTEWLRLIRAGRRFQRFVMRRTGCEDSHSRPGQPARRGVAALDYILVIGVILPLATIVVPTGMRIARATYDMLSVFVSWPFL